MLIELLSMFGIGTVLVVIGNVVLLIVNLRDIRRGP